MHIFQYPVFFQLPCVGAICDYTQRLSLYGSQTYLNKGTYEKTCLQTYSKYLSASADLFKVSMIRPGPEVIKLFSCSTQLSMKFFLLINVGILTFMNRKNSIISLSEPKSAQFPMIFILMNI